MQKQPPPPYFVLRGHAGSVSALHFTTELYNENNNPALVSGSHIGEIFIWNLKTNRTEHRLYGHEKEPIQFLHCYKSILLSEGRDGFVNIWNFIEQEWSITKKISSNSVCTGFCASIVLPIENSIQFMLANADKHILNIHSISGNQVKSLNFPSSYGMCMCINSFHKSGKMLLLIGFESGYIRLWDCEIDVELSSLECHSNPVICMDFDDKYQYMGISGSVDEYLETWSLSNELNLLKVKKIELKNKGTNTIKIRDDGKIAIAAGEDFNVRVFSWKKLQLLAVLQFHRLPILSLAFCSVTVGEYMSVFASGSKDQHIALWNIY